MRMIATTFTAQPTPGRRGARVGRSTGISLLLAGLLAWSGLTGEAAERKVVYPINAVATVGMVGDLVANIGGDKVKLTTLMGEGVDPHLYKPTRDDVQKLLSADIIFYSGLLLEGRMPDAFARVGRSGKPVWAVTEKLDESYLLEPPGMAGHWDPHVWMDVKAWSKASEVVEGALGEYDPANVELYRRNGARYREELARLDEYVRGVIASIPQTQRVLVTAHDAFNYFGRAYGIEVRGVQGISTESEAGVQDINRLIDFLVARQVPAIFVETSVSDKNMRALLEGAKAKGRQVKIGGSLFSDAMGRPGSYEGTYVGMIDHNATIIVRALGGVAPERGMSGKLQE
jgi:manganese/zinc/iron transport system substrate-binding protein